VELDNGPDLEYDSENVLAGLGSELDVSQSRDLGDYLHTLRNGTPDAITLLTYEDRMSQLDMESRGGCSLLADHTPPWPPSSLTLHPPLVSSGLSPTATPLINRITTRESLFLDFEDVERQVMAGDDIEPANME